MADRGEAIRDFFVKLGFDGSEVMKGLAAVDKEFSKFNKKMQSATKAQNREAKAQKSAQANTVKSKKEELSLERAQLALRKKIYKIRQQGGDPRRFQGSLNSKDISKVQKAIVSADRVLFEQEKMMSAEKKKQVVARNKLKALAEAEAKVNQINAKVEKQKLFAAKEAAKVSEHQERLRMRHARREDALLARRVATQNALNKTERRVAGMSINPQLAGEASTFNARREMLQRELSTARTSSEFAKLRAAISRLNDDTTRFISNNKRMQKQLTASAYSAKALKDSLNNLARSYVSVFAVIGGGAAFIRTGQELVALKTTLLAATGNAEDAGKAFEFVSNTAMNLGVDVASATKSFAQMGVAARNAGLSLEQTQEIFTGLSEASAAFGMSIVDQERAFRSVVQMLSKGQIMAKLWPLGW